MELPPPDPDSLKLRVPDWDAIGKAAGLDAGETEVLKHIAAGLSQEQAIGLCSHDSERKRSQAAWRRFNRHGCFPRVAAIISGRGDL